MKKVKGREKIVAGKIHAYSQFTALFINMQIVKFKSQLTFAFVAAVNHLSRPLRKQVYFNRFKSSWFVIFDWWISIC